MIKIAFGRIPGYEVSEIEINNSNGKSYTADTLIKLHERYKNAQVGFYLILGIDGLIDFPKWKNPERIFELAEVVILSRPGFSKDKIKPEYLKKVRFIDAELLNISSTMIRENVRNNKSIKSLVLPEIEKYITQNNLYK
jgi:nicotinate-nucleotide adenylyltransferase